MLYLYSCIASLGQTIYGLKHVNLIFKEADTMDQSLDLSNPISPQTLMNFFYDSSTRNYIIIQYLHIASFRFLPVLKSWISVTASVL